MRVRLTVSILLLIVETMADSSQIALWWQMLGVRVRSLGYIGLSTTKLLDASLIR